MEKVQSDKEVIRLPDINNSQAELRVFKGLAIGLTKKAIRYTNCWLGKFIGLTQVTMELREKHYNKRWILDTLHAEDIENKSLLKAWINRLYRMEELSWDNSPSANDQQELPAL